MVLLVAAVLLYLPFIPVYRFMAIGGYRRKWRAFVPLWNIFMMYELANAGRGNVFWVFATFPLVLAIRSVFVFQQIWNQDDTPTLTDFTFGYHTDLGQEVIRVDPLVTFLLWVLFLTPSFILLPIVGGRLAMRAGLPRWAGVVALIPGLWIAGLPILAMVARRNTGLAVEILPMPPFVDATTQPGRRAASS